MAHIRIHYNIKPYSCRYCNKSFNQKGNLKTHLRIHTGERPFKCRKCNKGFKALGQLNDHLISHTGFKPYQCPYCKNFYRRKEILKNHIFIHSKDSFFIHNREKFKDLQKQINQMKNYKYKFNMAYRAKEDKNANKPKNNNIFLFQSKLKIREKEQKKTENINDNFNDKNLKEEYFNNFLLREKLFDNENNDNGFKNEINNLLSSTVDFSINEDNYKKLNNESYHDFDFSDEKYYCGLKSKIESEYNIYKIYWKTYNTNLCRLYKNNLILENEDFSNRSNMFVNNPEAKKYIDEDFVYNY